MNSDSVQVKWDSQRKILFKNLNVFRNKEIHTDITLLCDGQKYPAHRLILTMTSGYFAKVLDSSQMQLSPSLVLICGIKGPVFEALLNFIYDGVTTIKGEEIPNLVQAGVIFEIPGLMEMGISLASSKKCDSPIPSSDIFHPQKSTPKPTLTDKKDATKEKIVDSDTPGNISPTADQMSHSKVMQKHQGLSATANGISDSSSDQSIALSNDPALSPTHLFSDHSHSEGEESFEGWETSPQFSTKETTKSSKRSHQCPNCSRSFFKQDSLASHVRTHKMSSFCKKCSKNFSTQRLYKNHLLTCYATEKTYPGKRKAEGPNPPIGKYCKKSDNEEMTIDSVLQDVSQSFSDDVKKSYLTTDDSIYDEEIKSKEETGSFQKSSVPTSALNKVQKPTQEAIDLEYSVASVLTKGCILCHLEFTDNREFKKHRTRDCILLECPYCLNNFRKEERMEYRKHVTTHRHTENPYTCPNCDFSTNRMKHFEDHVSVHTGVYRFSCTSCDFQTSNSFDLEIHSREKSHL